MKNAALIIGIAVFWISCDNPVSKKIKETKEVVENTTNAYKEAYDMKDKIEELTQEIPLTNEQIKEWLPESVDEMTRSAYRLGTHGMLNIASGEATYQSEDKTQELKIELLDGAGEVGALAIAGTRMVLSQEMEEETETRVKQTKKRDGVKVLEEEYKDGSRSTMEFLYKDRLYVKAQGKNMSADDLWKTLGGMNFDKLL